MKEKADEVAKPTNDELAKLTKDWHKADIIAALHKRGTSLAALSRENGLSDSTLANALSRSWPKGEIIIARAIEREPQEIWPSRFFNEDGLAITRKLRKSI